MQEIRDEFFAAGGEITNVGVNPHKVLALVDELDELVGELKSQSAKENQNE